MLSTLLLYGVVTCWLSWLFFCFSRTTCHDQDHMVVPFEVIPILSVDDEHGTLHVTEFSLDVTVQMGDRSAATLCDALGVASQNDTEKLKLV